MKYKIYNLFTDKYLQNLFLSDAKILYRQLANEYLQPRLQIKNNISSKGTFDDLLIAENYFRTFSNKPIISEDALIELLNSLESASADSSEIFNHAKYEETNLNLNTGESERYFSTNINSKRYWVKVKNSNITDLYLSNSERTESITWSQFNPITQVTEAYYTLDNNIEKKFIYSTDELDSEAIFCNYAELPNDFKDLTSDFMYKDRIYGYSIKPYGRVLGYRESSFPDNAKAQQVQDKIELNRAKVLAEITDRFSVSQTDDGEIWNPTDTTSWFE